MATSTSRLALLEPATGDAPSEIRLAITNHATTLDSAALDTQGTAVSRPAAATSGRYYESTDTGALDRDNGTAWNNIISAGDLKLSAASTAPSGWLLCDGSAISRTTFAVLFSALSTTYGAGDGSTTFNVPDYRGRTIIGAGAGAGLTARSRGQAGGGETHLLSVNEMPSHNHAVTDPGHNHALQGNYSISSNGLLAVSGGSISTGTTPVAAPNTAYATTGISIVNDGGGLVHNNMQPYGVANVFIKT